MRILYLLTQDLASPSGLGRFLPIAKAMSAAGHSVRITALHPNFSSLKLKKYSESNLDIEYVAQMHVKKEGNVKSYFSSLQLIYLSLKATVKLSLNALGNSADIVHICKPHPMNSIAGLLTRPQKKIVFLDCDDYEAASGNFDSRWKKTIVRLFENKIPFHVDSITTNTFFTRDRLCSLGVPEHKILYLPNGVDQNRFKQPNPETIHALRQSLALNGNKVVAYVGSLSQPSHALDLLISSFLILQQSRTDVILLLVGGGEEYLELQNKVNKLGIEKRVIFTGRIQPEIIVNYYYLADVCVDPVLDNDAARGRCPLKLFESWICGVPFVSGDVGDRKILIGNPPAGLLTQSSDPYELAACIRTILENETLARNISDLGREKVKAFFWSNLVRDLETAYQNFFITRKK